MRHINKRGFVPQAYGTTTTRKAASGNMKPRIFPKLQGDKKGHFLAKELLM